MIPELASVFLCIPAGPRELSLRIDMWIDVQMCTLSFLRLVIGVGTDLWSKRHVSLSSSSPFWLKPFWLKVVACPLVVNGVELVLSRFCFDGTDWRAWRDVVDDGTSTQTAERGARTGRTSGGTAIGSWQEPGGDGRDAHH